MKNGMLKKILAGMLAASVVVAMPLTASAAWKQTGNVWQWTENGQNATGWRWIQGAWYHFNASGDMTKGWLQENGTWYYLKGTGAMAQGWNLINGKWYCLNSNGSMRTGWVQTKGIWYFLAPNGDMQTGVVQVDGKTYLLDESGAMKTGKVEIDGKTYNFGTDGAAIGTAPKADKAFSTTSGSAATVPVKEPSRPSGGGSSGGGSVTPDPVPPAEKPDEVIGTSNYDTFAWGIGYKEVTIYAGNLEAGQRDFSQLQAEKVIVLGDNEPVATAYGVNLLSSPTLTLTFGAGAEIIEVQTTVKIAATEKLPSVVIATEDPVVVNAPADKVSVTTANSDVTLEKSVETVNVTAATTITANDTVGTVNANEATTVAGTGSVGTVNANKDTTIDLNVENVVAKAPVTVESGKEVQKITVPTGTEGATVTANGTVGEVVAESDTTVEGSGTVETVTAKKSVTLDTTQKVENVNIPSDATGVTIDGTGSIGTVKNESKDTEIAVNAEAVETTKDVTVNSTVGTVTVTENNVTVAKGDNGNITKVEATENVDQDTVTTPNGTTIVTIAETPKAGTDFTAKDADGEKPLKGTLTPATGTDAKLLQYNTVATADDNGWADFTGETELVPGTYYVRTKAKAESQVEASKPVKVTIKAFNGFAKDGVFYKDSVSKAGTAQFVEFEDVTYYITAEGKKVNQAGFYKVNGDNKEYYVDDNSVLVKAKGFVGNIYIDENGAKVTSAQWVTVGANSYYITADSEKTLNAWQLVDGTVHAYLDAETGVKGVTFDTASIKSGELTLIGVTTDMEYKVKGAADATYAKFESTTPVLEAGDYVVRYAANDTVKKAGPEVEVTVKAKDAKPEPDETVANDVDSVQKLTDALDSDKVVTINVTGDIEYNVANKALTATKTLNIASEKTLTIAENTTFTIKGTVTGSLKGKAETSKVEVDAGATVNGVTPGITAGNTYAWNASDNKWVIKTETPEQVGTDVVDVANMVDQANPSDNITPAGYAVSTTKIGNAYTSVLTADANAKVPYHMNAQNKYGYWVGIEITAPEGAAKAEVKWRDGTAFENEPLLNNQFSAYINLDTATDKTRTLDVKWTIGEEVVEASYTIDGSQLTVDQAGKVAIKNQSAMLINDSESFAEYPWSDGYTGLYPTGDNSPNETWENCEGGMPWMILFYETTEENAEVTVTVSKNDSNVPFTSGTVTLQNAVPGKHWFSWEVYKRTTDQNPTTLGLDKNAGAAGDYTVTLTVDGTDFVVEQAITLPDPTNNG